MNKAWDEFGEKWPGTVADTIRIELHQASSPYTRTLARFGVPLNTDGTMDISIPGTLSGTYYIVPVHKNSLETWSSVPVSFSGSVVHYDFSNDISNAYGDNMKTFPGGHYALYGGDVNTAGNYYPAPPSKDGMIDTEDVYYIFDSYNNGDLGYVVPDMNGDGMVDSNDMYIAYDNYLAGVYSMTP